MFLCQYIVTSAQEEHGLRLQPGLVTRNGHLPFVLQKMNAEMSPPTQQQEGMAIKLHIRLKLARTDIKVKSIQHPVGHSSSGMRYEILGY